MTATRLPDWVKPGAAYRFDAGSANPHTGRKFHVRALVDDHVVIREWRNGAWRYRIEGAEYFTAMADYIRTGTDAMTAPTPTPVDASGGRETDSNEGMT